MNRNSTPASTEEKKQRMADASAPRNLSGANEKFARTPTTGIIWLASYPKSGNTWLRFLLHNYFYGEARKSDDIAKRIPNIHVRADRDLIQAWQTKLVFCKTHFMYSESHPEISGTAGFIYILRHPKDVLLSNLNYYKLNNPIRRVSDQEFARAFIVDMGVRRWIDMGIGAWPEHAGSWLIKPRYPCITLRYEEMLRDTRSSLQSMLEFLQIPIDQNKLNRAVHLSSFDKMRAMEEAEKKKGNYGTVFQGDQETEKLGARFMNKGKAVQTLRHLGEDIEQEFNEKFGDVMRAFGYE